MKMAKSTYYHQKKRPDDQLQNDLILREKIEQIQSKFPGYGYRRIREHLLRQDQRVNSKRIRRIMRDYSLFAAFKNAFKQRSGALGKKVVFPNIAQGMKLTGPNQLWATDFTFIRLLTEYVYLCAIIDVYTRKIVGWAISREVTHKFCLQALQSAVKKERPQEGLVHHSDRGIQYACDAYVEYLETKKFQISMSRLATPQDNAFIESFFKTLKREEVFARGYENMSDVLRQLPKFIDEIYNTERLHSSLGYRSPREFEVEIIALKPARRPVQKVWSHVV